MAKADTIKMLKTAKQVLIGFTGPNREPIYLTPDFAQQLAEALEDTEPGTTQVTNHIEITGPVTISSSVPAASGGKPVELMRYTS
jgi:hypothetical protein